LLGVLSLHEVLTEEDTTVDQGRDGVLILFVIIYISLTPLPPLPPVQKFQTFQNIPLLPALLHHPPLW
jgi:hypothetical protein